MNKSRFYSIYIAFIVALGGFLMGFDASVISGVIKFVSIQFELTDVQHGFAVACLTLTSTIGMMISGPISDRIGRKKVLIIASILHEFDKFQNVGFDPTIGALPLFRIDERGSFPLTDHRD